MPTNLETSLEKLRAERKPLADLFDKNPKRLVVWHSIGACCFASQFTSC